MQNNINKPLCDHCGQTLENFLNEMEEHNLDVVCPACGKTQSGTTHAHDAADNGGSSSPRAIQSTSQKDAQPDPHPGSSKKH